MEETETLRQSSSSDDYESTEVTIDLPPAPDGGWGWAVLLGAFMVNFLSDGLAFSYGVLFTHLENYFGESKSATSWVGSVFVSVPLMSGPIASALTTKYGCRNTTIAGGIITSVGFILSYFATSLEILCVTFGIIAGFGLSLGYMTSLVSVAFYFEKKRAFATGLSVCGSGIGTFVFAPLMEILLEEYGWRGTILILGGIMGNIIVCGAVFRPLEFSSDEKRRRALEAFQRYSDSLSKQSLPSKQRSRHHSRNIDSSVSLSDSQSNSSSTSSYSLSEEQLTLSQSQVQFPTFTDFTECDIPEEFIKEAQNNKYTLQQTIQRYIQTLQLERTNNCNLVTNDNNTLVITSQDKIITLSDQKKLAHSNGVHSQTNVAPKSTASVHNKRLLYYLPLYRKDLFYRGNLTNISTQHYKSASCPEIYIHENDDSDSISFSNLCNIPTWLKVSKHVSKVLKTMFDFKILSHPLFFIYAISNFVLYFWYDIPYVFYVDRAIEKGIPETSASFLISVLGITNTIGQIVYGLLGDCYCVRNNLVYALSTILCGLVILPVPLFEDYIPLAILSGLFGFFISANYALSTVLLVDYLGLDKLSNAYGLLMLIQGVANLVGPPSAGLLYDVSGNYNNTFYVAGGCIVLSGVIVLLIPALKPIIRRRHYKKNYVTEYLSETASLTVNSRRDSVAVNDTVV